jgi:hypothetical protein
MAKQLNKDKATVRSWMRTGHIFSCRWATGQVAWIGPHGLAFPEFPYDPSRDTGRYNVYSAYEPNTDDHRIASYVSLDLAIRIIAGAV